VSIQRSLVENDHVVEALATNRADDALHVRSLPRRARRRQNFFDPNDFLCAKLAAEDAVAVLQQVPRDLFKRKSLAALLAGPLGGGARSR
jgi:hypothetical protein